MALEEAFGIVSGVFWTICYLLVIRQAFRDRTYAMPLLAIAMNVTWEFLFSFVYPSGGSQEAFNVVWFVLDLVILYTYIRFWRADYPRHLPANLVWPWLILAFVACVPLYVAIVDKFGADDGSAYTAFGDNLIMSVLFIAMLVRRGDRSGQSLGIAWTKLIGTATASAAQYISDPTNAVWNVLYIEILVFDLLYVVMLMRAPRHFPETQLVSSSIAVERPTS